MAEIIRDATTVGDILDAVEQRLLNGLFTERVVYRTGRDIARNEAQRHAVRIAFEDLREVWCPDANTRLAEVLVPTHTNTDDFGNPYNVVDGVVEPRITVGDFVGGLVAGGGTNIADDDEVDGWAHTQLEALGFNVLEEEDEL